MSTNTIRKVVAVVACVLLASAIVWILFGAMRFLHIGSNPLSNPVDSGNIVPVIPTAPIVGGDRDAHGCIGSAGYTWCEQKQKCLRIWEEPCASQTGGAQICTQDAKQCSDGSYVSRTGLNCEFTPCPGSPSGLSTRCGKEGELLQNGSLGPNVPENNAKPTKCCDGLQLVMPTSPSGVLLEGASATCQKIQPCGGIAGIICPQGYDCKKRGDYPDASGSCVRAIKGADLR